MVINSEDKAVEGRTSASYVKVRDWLLAYIDDRNLHFGDRIPSERILADQLGLSRPKVARAVAELVAEGVLMREHRSGTFVGDTPSRRVRNATRTISVIHAGIKGSTDPVQINTLFDNTVQGVSSVINEYGYSLVIRYNNFVEEEFQALTELGAYGIAGAVVFPGFSDESERYYSKLAPCDPPIVLVDRYFPDFPIDYVVTDNFAGARDAVRHLIDKGHRRIAFFTDFSDFTSVNDRDAGYRAALEEAGIPYDEDIVCGPQIMRHTYFNYDYTLEHLLRLPEPVTAIFGMNDNLVWAALQAIHNLGLSAPNDIEVAGYFDSCVPDGIRTPFTRVIQPSFKMGQTAARVLLERISGNAPEGPCQVLLPPTLVE